MLQILNTSAVFFLIRRFFFGEKDEQYRQEDAAAYDAGVSDIEIGEAANLDEVSYITDECPVDQIADGSAEDQ
jgi:hypothetical protein